MAFGKGGGQLGQRKSLLPAPDHGERLLQQCTSALKSVRLRRSRPPEHADRDHLDRERGQYSMMPVDLSRLRVAEVVGLPDVTNPLNGSLANLFYCQGRRRC